jgi:hypothetical protein
MAKCMQCGGATKLKKMKSGGMVGMPKYSNDPRTDAGRTLKKGGVVKKYAKGGFPDLNKDGKITKADILKGRGVIKKRGGAVKK